MLAWWNSITGVPQVSAAHADAEQCFTAEEALAIKLQFYAVLKAPDSLQQQCSAGDT